MSIIPSSGPVHPSIPSTHPSDDPVTELSRFGPFITQQICSTVSDSLIFPLFRSCYLISHDLIRLSKTVCTVQNIVSHPIQSIAVGFLLYTDLYGTRNIAFQAAAAVVVISAVEEYLQNINGIATLKKGCLKVMEMSKTLGKCQANTVPILSYAEKSTILLSRKIYFFSNDLYRVLKTPERLREDVDTICQIAKEELIDSLKSSAKEQSSASKSDSTMAPKTENNQKLIEPPNVPILPLALPVPIEDPVSTDEPIGNVLPTLY